MIKEFNSQKEAVGYYVIMFLDGVGNYVVKVLEVDDTKNLVKYEVVTGENKGSTKWGRYVPGRKFTAYDEDSLAKAVMEVCSPTK